MSMFFKVCERNIIKNNTWGLISDPLCTKHGLGSIVVLQYVP